MKSSRRPIILVGGGSGGHIFPLLAVAEELQARQIPFVFIGSASGKEKSIVESQKWPFRAISAGKWRRHFSLASFAQNIIDIFRFIWGFFQSLALLISVRPLAVFSKGGFVALPVCLAAKLLGVRLIVHESDSVMGLTNRICSRFAHKVLVAFDPEMYPTHSPRYIQVGVPMKRNLRQAAKLPTPKKSRPLIVVIAGIQGSQFINQMVRENLVGLLKEADIIHSTGDTDYLPHKALAAKLPPALRSAYKPMSFIGRELAYYYQAADLVISRASMTVICEAALFSKSLYLIPLPSAAADHQTKNALILESAGAAVASRQQSLTREQFLHDIVGLLHTPEKLSSMAGALRGYFNENDSIEIIINLLTDGKTEGE
ncbi:hypothetical protein A3A71_01735 [Candidatus Berkelbacteria bacterium RIFCSPLOWO2_01_FULL_50_28]|uniref:UDP-N-acetylglucosamine--N-acetylmuramyl-(pentapeptide) pyrophosphoryl-undecaprenol N-acetylglucosamine transferase n=1 Tax=Candidatus Berkelbacteria bacterium RIFCSPLOWO2_01_FULL_50_28 TaxID=1797471 RepID=A0A1F5EC08_9BACT|nr:MAG: hypothetical protein A3F39_01585 [Candidatus Berkelbacteria bacterium RIFCSPHIGHO2_12_FULL_50_11]OGD64754.1 MAG: hypothetical protein A3A71_01735 [Candidatus Berkelbacteria bacterium RIFCSPLOWO2_01_FULL_50_28]